MSSETKPHDGDPTEPFDPATPRPAETTTQTGDNVARDLDDADLGAVSGGIAPRHRFS